MDTFIDQFSALPTGREAWRRTLALEVVIPVMHTLTRNRQIASVPGDRMTGEKNLDTVFNLIQRYAELQLNVGEQQYFDQNLLRKQVSDLEADIRKKIGDNGKAEKFMQALFSETENRMMVFQISQTAKKVAIKFTEELMPPRGKNVLVLTQEQAFTASNLMVEYAKKLGLQRIGEGNVNPQRVRAALTQALQGDNAWVNNAMERMEAIAAPQLKDVNPRGRER